MQPTVFWYFCGSCWHNVSREAFGQMLARLHNARWLAVTRSRPMRPGQLQLPARAGQVQS